MNNKIVLALIAVIIISGCVKSNEYPNIHRESLIPENAVKISPETDLNPPLSLSDEYFDPVPLPYPINTAGGEDSAFILPNGEILYFWFTPDVNIPAQEQLFDKVTGIYVSNKINGDWSEPERVWLSEPGILSLDGCAYINESNDFMLFCSAREGYSDSGYGGGLNWFSAEFDNSSKAWSKLKIIDFTLEYEVGELHIQGNEIYFHSSRPEGMGGMDIWVMRINPDGSYGEPVNIESVNTENDEGFPSLSPDGQELWISRNYGLWRSKRINDEWSNPELMISPLAGEASIDKDGNVYFTHHFFEIDENDEYRMIEADIYVAYKR